MTLSTNVYVLDEIDPREVFRFCQGLLTKYDEDRRTPDQQVWSDEPRKTYRDRQLIDDPDGRRSIANQLGQGLPGILDITYRTGGPLRTEAQAAEHDEDCSDDCSGRWHDQPCWLDVDFDTAYGATFEGGMGCGDLHAALVAELGQWLTGKGIRWRWRNEFTGEVHDDPAKLIELVSGGFEAAAWFQTSALPAILASSVGVL